MERPAVLTSEDDIVFLPEIGGCFPLEILSFTLGL
jgi:hypothetical protein